jgi:hypothetical protein
MSIRVAFGRFCSLISKGGRGLKAEKYLRTARRIERMDLLSTTGGQAYHEVSVPEDTLGD